MIRKRTADGILEKQKIGSAMNENAFAKTCFKDSGAAYQEQMASMFESIDFYKDWEDSSEEKEMEMNLDLVTLYLNEIGRFRLLTEEEERACAVKVRNGDEEARTLMINSNLRLVVRIAKRYAFRGNLMDLVQAGNIGLMKAVDRYDPENGTRFGVFAAFWIKQAVIRAISSTNGPVRIPPYIYEMIPSILRFREKYLISHEGENPDIDVIAKKFGFSEETVKSLFFFIADAKSLDILESDVEDNRGRVYLISDEDVEERVTQNLLKEEIISVLQTVLTERERLILQMRYGMTETGETMTLEQIGKCFNLTRERIRQILNTVTQKLQNSKIVAERLWPWYVVA